MASEGFSRKVVQVTGGDVNIVVIDSGCASPNRGTRVETGSSKLIRDHAGGPDGLTGGGVEGGEGTSEAAARVVGDHGEGLLEGRRTDVDYTVSVSTGHGDGGSRVTIDHGLPLEGTSDLVKGDHEGGVADTNNDAVLKDDGSGTGEAHLKTDGVEGGEVEEEVEVDFPDRATIGLLDLVDHTGSVGDIKEAILDSGVGDNITDGMLFPLLLHVLDSAGVDGTVADMASVLKVVAPIQPVLVGGGLELSLGVSQGLGLGKQDRAEGSNSDDEGSH